MTAPGLNPTRETWSENFWILKIFCPLHLELPLDFTEFTGINWILCFLTAYFSSLFILSPFGSLFPPHEQLREAEEKTSPFQEKNHTIVTTLPGMNSGFTGSFLPFPCATSSPGSCSAEEQPEHSNAVPGPQPGPFPLGAHTEGCLGMQPGMEPGGLSRS